MNIFSSRAVVAGCVFAALLSTVSPALAENDRMSWSTSVQTRDLDLSTTSGAQTLQRRLDAAIRSACGPLEFGQPAFVDLRLQSQARDACLANARAAAAPKVQMLIARHSTKMAAN
jgi:UrcA family protein